MLQAAPWIVFILALVSGFEAWGQPARWTISTGPATPSWPLGPPRSTAKFEGLLIRSDGDTLSVALTDQRVIRFQLSDQTKYTVEGAPRPLSDFSAADVVSVDAEVNSQGNLVVRTMRFLRKGTAEEKSLVQRSPEVSQRWRSNVIGALNIDPEQDDRRLELVAKPQPISLGSASPSAQHLDYMASSLGQDPAQADPVARIRRAVNAAFERLPSFRAKQITSLFGSESKPIKWVPDGVISVEIAYEEQHELYSDIQVDGAKPTNAPLTGDADYMRSLNKAWSTGDFKTISHCVFAELQDSDFHKVRTEPSTQGPLEVYQFSGSQPSTCVGILFRSQVAYPGFKGLLKVKANTGDVLHVELEARDLPAAFPIDRAQRSVDFSTVRIGGEEYQMPTTSYWFGCFRNSYSCFLNRVDFRDYRRFEGQSTVHFEQ